MKLYKVFVKDYVGAVYSPGYYLADSFLDAGIRARGEWGSSSFVREADEVVDSIEGLMDIENQMTHSRMRKAA